MATIRLLGSFPLGNGTYLPLPDSRALVTGIRSLIGFGNLVGPLASRRPSGLRKTRRESNSLAHRTTWLRSDFWGVSLLRADVITRALPPRITVHGIRSLVRFGNLVGPLAVPVLYLRSRRPSGLRKTRRESNSLAHRTTWLRSDLGCIPLARGCYHPWTASEDNCCRYSEFGTVW